MKVTFKSSSNKNFKELENIKGELHIGLTLFFDFNNDLNGEWIPSFDLRKGTMSSSIIKTINYEEVKRDYYIITITTKNSEYIFSSGEETDKEPLSDEEVLSMQLAFGMHLF